MTDKIVALTTCSSQEQAAQLARHLIESRLAACATILPGARSFYRWKGNIENAQEFVVLIKTRLDSFETLKDAITKLSTQEVPEIIALPIVAGSDKYLGWMDEELPQ